jgi:hypothetical protein
MNEGRKEGKYQDLIKENVSARGLWLMPIILATQEAEIRRIMVQSQPGQIVPQVPIWKKTHHKKGLVEWLTVSALSSNPST